ncbi:hypothetical protein PENSPDRAFT_691483 [Peniophora sp. CONT]|nr:hypothetical protein PENSPDRAFT_691483 [Peniophora sp. CONT]
MFSFMKIATFAALAFGTLASAAPSPAPFPAFEAGALMARDAQAATDVTSILTKLNSDLQAPTSQLNGLTAENATPENVNVIVLKIKVLIEAATEACGKAPGVGSGNILLLLSISINLVISACNHCYSVCSDKVNVLVVLQLLDVVLAALISIVFKLVGGLLTVVIGLLVGLLGGLVELIISLKFTACIKVLLLL